MVAKTDIIDMFSNLSFTILEHPSLGKIIETSAEDAFIFSSVVGANYLVNEYGVTMKGRSEVFIHRSVFQDGHYIYSPGLFERDTAGTLIEGNSANILNSMYPTIFSGKKYIYIVEINKGKTSNIEPAIFARLKETDISPADVLLFKLKDTGSTLEPLYEYFTSLNFIKEGYIVENQVPWFQQNYKYDNKTIQGGIPDFSAFHSNISNQLAEYGLITPSKGVHVSLLPVLKLFRTFKKENPSSDLGYDLIIGEVKSSKNSLPQALAQLEKYNSVRLAKQFYTIIPDVEDNASKFGEIYFKNNRLEVKYAGDSVIDTSVQEMDSIWIDTYIKMLLLGNLNFNDIISFITASRKEHNQNILDSYEAIHLIDAVINTKNEIFIQFLTSKI
jgi:hypothetical protein